MVVDLVGALADPGVVTDAAPPGHDGVRRRRSSRSSRTSSTAPTTTDRRRRASTTRSATTRSSGSRSTAAGRRSATTRARRRLGAGAEPADDPPDRRRPRRPHGPPQPGGADGGRVGPARQPSARSPTSSTAAGSARRSAALAGAPGGGRERRPRWPSPRRCSSFVRVDGEPARKVVADSLAPVGDARPRLDRGARRGPAARPRRPRSCAARRADASARPAARAFAYQASRRPRDARGRGRARRSRTRATLFIDDRRRHPRRRRPARDAASAARARRLSCSAPSSWPAGPSPSQRSPRPRAVPQASATARRRRTRWPTLDPLLADARLARRADPGARRRCCPAGELPAELALAPEFRDPLFWDLAELDPDVIVPGLGEFPVNRVRLLGVNAGLRRRLPRRRQSRDRRGSSSGASTRPTSPPRSSRASSTTRTRTTVDIDADRGLAAEARRSRATCPNADTTHRDPDPRRPRPPLSGRQRLPRPAAAAASPTTRTAIQPSFEGRLGGDVLVVGFPRATDVVLGQTGGREYFVVIEERVTAPRFGLDLERTASADDVGRARADRLPGGGRPRPDRRRSRGSGSPDIDDVKWGRNSAHLAAAVHQRRSGGSSRDAPGAAMRPARWIDPRRTPSGPRARPLDPALPFDLLDDELPLALFPVRLGSALPARTGTRPRSSSASSRTRSTPTRTTRPSRRPSSSSRRRYWDWIWRAAARSGRRRGGAGRGWPGSSARTGRSTWPGRRRPAEKPPRGRRPGAARRSCATVPRRRAPSPGTGAPAPASLGRVRRGRGDGRRAVLGRRRVDARRWR